MIDNNIKEQLIKMVSRDIVFFSEMNYNDFVLYFKRYTIFRKVKNEIIKDVYYLFEEKFIGISLILKRFEEKDDFWITIAYLVRYGNDKTINFIQTQLWNDQIRDKLYIKILSCCEKYGFDRMLDLSYKIRQFIIDENNR